MDKKITVRTSNFTTNKVHGATITAASETLTWHRGRSHRWLTCSHGLGTPHCLAPAAIYSLTPRGPFDQKTNWQSQQHPQLSTNKAKHYNDKQDCINCKSTGNKLSITVSPLLKFCCACIWRLQTRRLTLVQDLWLRWPLQLCRKVWLTIM